MPRVVPWMPCSFCLQSHYVWWLLIFMHVVLRALPMIYDLLSRHCLIRELKIHMTPSLLLAGNNLTLSQYHTPLFPCSLSQLHQEAGWMHGLGCRRGKRAAPGHAGSRRPSRPSSGIRRERRERGIDKAGVASTPRQLSDRIPTSWNIFIPSIPLKTWWTSTIVSRQELMASRFRRCSPCTDTH